ncbi:hypothetical protein [Desulfobacula sp.]|uniref:hypothetical protein n=1 Tax=Desulfobacula sp. TaxID=2593537 RepID=UPI001ECEDFF5|nr:hypothetical protein [Desulfobacula sp.]
MKKKIRSRRCKNCNDLFKPDSRNLKRQKFCRKSECKEASKRYSQQQWLMKPQNKDHFSGPANVIRVQQWRQKNPGYWKRKKPKKVTSLIKGALQETLSSNTTINKGFPSDLMQTALQDSLSAKSLIIIGFDTQLNKTALQDIIDFTDQGAVKLVPDVLKKLIDQKKGDQHGQILFFPGTI